jgi:hypothetical protein
VHGSFPCATDTSRTWRISIVKIVCLLACPFLQRHLTGIKLRDEL